MSHFPEAWTRIGAYQQPAFSKDGTRLFHLRGTGLPQAWVMDLDGSNARPLTAFDEKVAIIRRSPLDDRIIVGIDAGGDERQQFHLITPEGETTALTEAPDVIHDFGAWSPDATRIAYTANDRDERIFDVLIRELATGAVTQVLEGPGQISVSGWNGERLAAIQDHSSSDQRLWIIELDTGATKIIPAPGLTRYTSVRWQTDGSLMGLTDHGGADFMRLCRIDITNGGVSLVHAAEGRDVEAWSQAPNRGSLAVIENDRGYARLYVDGVLVNGLPEGIVADLAWSPDGTTLAFTAQSPTDPAGIWLWCDGKATCLLRPDPRAEAGIDPATMVAPHLVEWKGTDGTTIPGWFAMPKTPAPPGGYPSVVWVHGGPASQTRANFRADTQMLLDQGFAVLLPNVRGSTGYGRALMESDDNHLRPACLSDLAEGRHWLAAQPGINPDKIGVMGQSYGGWMVLGAITLYPDLWAAAVNYYGIADFVTLLEKTGPWRRDHRAREYGFPETHEDLFADISPIRHVSRVTAPLLVAHGNRDPRVPKNESDTFVSAMQKHQKKVVYAEFDYAGHGFIRPAHRTRIFNLVAEHFREHMA
jgi:dipeptidyl aminopeptidase/acylaminoacyl peptidase